MTTFSNPTCIKHDVPEYEASNMMERPLRSLENYPCRHLKELQESSSKRVQTATGGNNLLLASIVQTVFVSYIVFTCV